MKKLFVLIVVVLIICFVGGCNNAAIDNDGNIEGPNYSKQDAGNETSSSTTGTTVSTSQTTRTTKQNSSAISTTTEDLSDTTLSDAMPQGIPNITSFSGTKLEPYEKQFPPVSSACMIVDGKKYRVKKDDPRLIRLLNFIAYNENERHPYMRQSLVLQEEINEIRDSHKVLQVTFDAEQINGEGYVNHSSKIWIYGSAYLSFRTKPYGWIEGQCAEQFLPYCQLASGKEDKDFNMDGWMDMLKEAEFY